MEYRWAPSWPFRAIRPHWLVDGVHTAASTCQVPKPPACLRIPRLCGCLEAQRPQSGTAIG